MDKDNTKTTDNAVPNGFVSLTPLEMNGVTFNARRTLITPALLARMAQTAEQKPTN